MDVVIHCSNCQTAIRVPSEAAGHEARCPSCQQMFTIPGLDNMLEDTITGWIVHDVEEMLQSKDQAVTSRPLPAVEEPTRPAAAAATEEKAPESESKQSSHDSGERRYWKLKPAEPSTAQDSEVPAEATSTAATTTAAATAVKSEPRTISASEAQAQGYPTNLRVKGPIPHLVVHKVNTAGVRFAFDADWLRDERFCASMPVRCVFTGETNREQLIARPIFFEDRLTKTNVNVEQVVAAHTVRKLADKHPRQIVRAMGRVEILPEPFCHAMPYYVSTKYAHYALHVQTHDRTSGAVTCDVLIPDPPTALKWLGRVNGVCGPEFELLERDVSLLHGNAWRQMDEDCRARIDVWCKLESDEKFRQYFNDADFGKNEAGLAGLVVTDRRIFFCKHHRRGHVKLNRPNTSLVVQREGQLAHLTLEHDGEHHHMVTLRAADLDELNNLLAGNRVQLTVVQEI
ncbi:MAG: hypothetical protein IT445_18430 [Phycisphaeraceae bacterium]|nr:hypothetical protein [Phycisphaeraceae bacterium]